MVKIIKNFYEKQCIEKKNKNNFKKRNKKEMKKQRRKNNFKNYLFSNNSLDSSRATTAGNGLPANISMEAPPPLLIWSILSP